MQIADLVDPFADFAKAFPRGSWDIEDGLVVFRTNEFLDDEDSLPRFKEMFA